LAFRDPRQALFNEYHVFYRFDRLLGWEDVNVVKFNLSCVVGLIESPQGVLLILLAAAALLPMDGENGWDERVKTEIRLCAWLAVSLGLFLSLVPPTFGQYFVLVMPFAGILGAVGIAVLAVKFPSGRRRFLALAVAIVLYAVPSARALHGHMTMAGQRWVYWESIAGQAGAVTPPNGLLYSPWDLVYFLEKGMPPPGLGSFFSQALPLPAVLASRLHLLPQSQIDNWLAQGHFATVVIGADDPRIEKLGLRGVYAHTRMLDPEIAMFWMRKASER
jgi:hypothetical protein